MLLTVSPSAAAPPVTRHVPVSSISSFLGLTSVQHGRNSMEGLTGPSSKDTTWVDSRSSMAGGPCVTVVDKCPAAAGVAPATGTLTATSTAPTIIKLSSHLGSAAYGIDGAYRGVGDGALGDRLPGQGGAGAPGGGGRPAGKGPLPPTSYGSSRNSSSGGSKGVPLGASRIISPGMSGGRIVAASALCLGAVALLLLGYGWKPAAEQEHQQHMPADDQGAARSNMQAEVGQEGTGVRADQVVAFLGGRPGGVEEGGVEGAPEGGWEFDAWMVERLADALAGYKAEEVLLRQELAALMALEHSKSRWWRWGTKGEKVGHDAGKLAGGAAGVAALGGGGGDGVDCAARIAEITEQLSSIEVLQEALRSEMGRYRK